MSNDDLRDKIVEWLSNETTLLEVECEAAGDAILSLIESERCVWTLKDDEFTMSCGESVPQYDEEGVWVKDDMPPYCWHCGKRIEVKEGLR
jgi:hypothetical protein